MELCVDEGALSSVTVVCFPYRDSPNKREWGRHNDGRPSSKPAMKKAGSLGEVELIIEAPGRAP